ncbi:MAG: FtsB family cell division protein [Chitinophagaceae bacterium]|jgi:cell division protein DivIC
MKKAIKIITNKYFIAPAFMLVWLCFFDDVTLLDQKERLSQVKTLEKKKEYYIKEIAQANLELKAIEQSSEAIEKFARERYLMKKPGEDIFILTPVE